MSDPGGHGVLTIGSLFTGTGMLDAAVEESLGAETIWRSDVKPAACKLIEHYWPGTNLGDITAIDWSQVEPVDVITGGSPCQDMSSAGRRAGMTSASRSGLWSYMRDAIETIRPRLVVWENVRGALSAEADSALESREGRLGIGAGRPVLRAAGRVVGDLASLGYRSGWCGLSVADIGGAHARFRIFVVASRPDAIGSGRDGRPLVQVGREEVGATAAGGGEVPERLALLPTPEAKNSHAGPDFARMARQGSGGHDLVTALALLPTPTASGYGSNQSLSPGAVIRPSLDGLVRLLPTPDNTHGRTTTRTGPLLQGVQEWKEYGPAIRRQETAFGRLAPCPTEIGPKGGRRLAPEFSEWLMGWPAGWTDIPGLSRAERLSLCGDGVVVPQAREALRRLLPIVGGELGEAM